jgi:hypothetical protein
MAQEWAKEEDMYEEIVNLTPHEIKIVGGLHTEVVAPSGVVARVSVQYEDFGDVNGIPVFTSSYGEVVGLPSPEEGKVFVVSSMVLAALDGRTDVFAPGELIRDDAGKPVGCRGLVRKTLASQSEVRKVDTPEDLIKKRVLEKALLLSQGNRERCLIDVIASHNEVISKDNLPPGVGYDNPCRVVKGGYNGKRPIYLIGPTSSGEYSFAQGTHFGRNSSFRFVKVEDIARDILDAKDRMLFGV